MVQLKIYQHLMALKVLLNECFMPISIYAFVFTKALLYGH